MTKFEFVPPDQRPQASPPSSSTEPVTPEPAPLTAAERLQRSAPHRRKVTDWICQAFEPGQARCCVIGPGCGGHLDLIAAVEHFSELHLIDFSQDNLDQVIQNQGADPDRIHTHVLADFAGVVAALDELRSVSQERELRFHDVQEVISAAQNLSAWPVPEGFDIVLSAEATGVVMSACAAITGGEHPSLPDLMHAVRVRHIQEMLRICGAEGIGMVINQLVSSRVMPSLAKIPAEKLELVLSELVRDRRIPIGSSPIQLRDMLEHDQELKSRVSLVHLLRPWIFDAGPYLFAMAGVSFRKARQDDAEEPSLDVES